MTYDDDVEDKRPTREPYATTSEVAAYYKISRGTLYNWRTAGRGPRVTRVGGRLRYRWQDVEAYAQQGYATT